MKVKDFMSVIKNADNQSVVVLEHGKDIYDITPNGELYEAEKRYGWVAENFPQYPDAEIESVSYQRYSDYHSTLVIQLKAA